MAKTEPETIIVVLGTGRCGTKSLHTLLNEQPGVTSTHEFGGQLLLPWRPDQRLFKQALQVLMTADTPIVASVASFQLPYVHMFREALPNKTLKFVCLERDRTEVIESFMAWTGRKNHWQPRPEFPNVYDHCFPTCNKSITKQGAIGKYWSQYHGTAKQQEEQFDDFGIFKTDSLNSRMELEALFNWLGLKDFHTKIFRENKGTK